MRENKWLGAAAVALLTVVPIALPVSKKGGRNYEKSTKK